MRRVAAVEQSLTEADLSLTNGIAAVMQVAVVHVFFVFLFS
jgi:hypothetical protein